MAETIKKVYVFQNGMVMVFNGLAMQMPEYQGRWEDMKEKILKDKPKNVEVLFDCVFERNSRRKDRADFSRITHSGHKEE